MAQKKNVLQVRLEYALAVALLGSLRRLPLSIANRVARLSTRFMDLAIPRLRRTALTNLSFALPELSEEQRDRIVDGVFRSLARLLVALAHFPAFTRAIISDWIGYEGLENYMAAKQEGRGVLVATAHLGNWELSAFSHAFMTEPMNVMVRALDNPLIDQLVESYRTRSGNRLIYKKDAARSVLKALRNNEAVGILIDQNTSAAEGAFIDFFGKKACAGTAFVKFAYHSGAIVIPGFAFWDETHDQYILRFYPRIEMTGDAVRDTQAIHSQFERLIREYPDQWMWIHRRWKTRPPGEATLY